MKEDIRKNYHFVIAAVALLEMLVWGGICNNTNALYVIPVSEDLNVSRGSFSLAMSLGSLTNCLSAPVTGMLLQKYGFRKLASGGLIVIGLLSLLTASYSKSLGLLAVASAVRGSLNGVCATIGLNKIVCNWFHRRRGLILGLVSASSGIGGSLFCILQTGIIEADGWRASYQFCGLSMLAAAVIIFLFVRDHPEDMKLQPYGAGVVPVKKLRRRDYSTENWPGFCLAEMLRRPMFYLMLLLTFSGCLSIYLLFYDMLPIMRDYGLSSQQAASVQSVMLFGLTVSTLITGYLSDLIGPRKVAVLSMLCGVTGLCLFNFISSITVALIAASIYTFALPMTTIIVPLLTRDIFGYRASDTATGIFMSAVALGGFIASPLMNWIHDSTGSYHLGLRMAPVLAAAVTGLYGVLFILAKRYRRKLSADI